jgi:hypothetical protein
VNAAKTAASPAFTTGTGQKISGDDLHGGGWYHEDELDMHECECSAACCIDGEEEPPLYDPVAVIGDLHRQAHPSQHPDPLMCREEPCRSLPLGALRLTVPP